MMVPGRSPGLPVYLECPACDGTGDIYWCPEGCTSGQARSAGPVGRCCELTECEAKDCLEGIRLCSICIRNGQKPCVIGSGPDYLIDIGAVAMEEDEAFCALHRPALMVAHG